MPKDQQHHVNNGSHNIKNTSYMNERAANAVKYPIIMDRVQNQLRLLQFETKTLHEILNILKQRLDETRNTGNKEDLAQLWTKYHVHLRELEQQIEDHTIVIAAYQFEQKTAIHTTLLNDRLARFNHMINTMRTQLESSKDFI